MPRSKNPHSPVLLRVKVSSTVKDYLEAVAVRGLHGNQWTDVAAYLVRDGIERLIREGTIPRRSFNVPYTTETDPKDEDQ